MSKHLSLRVDDKLHSDLLLLGYVEGDDHINETVRRHLQKTIIRKRKKLKKWGGATRYDLTVKAHL